MGPRVLEIDLASARAGTLRAAAVPWRSDDAALDQLGSAAGPALAAAILTERARRDPDGEVPLVISVGEAVRRGLPTAARASISSRAPLSGLYAEGQVGSDFARRLAGVADALVVCGRTSIPGAVLHVRSGSVELASDPELTGLASLEKHARLQARFGTCASLSIGPAGERGLACASLAACSSAAVGGGPPHFVGRGGLGAVLGRTGLAAIAVSAAAPTAARDGKLVELCTSSPRLASRASGGTLELTGAFAARGDLRARNYAADVPREVVDALERDVEASRSAQHGCHGCPTPCGWMFELPGRGAQGARFGASYALGLNLGLARFEDSLELLAACDAAGLDAKEIGAGLALLCTARDRDGRARAWGDRATLLGWIDDALRGEGEGARLGAGAASLARALGLVDASRSAKGMAARPESNLAALLGQCVSARGADPMRAFPFLAADGSGRERLVELLAPISLPRGAEDPHDPAGKGRIVWWHENLAAALDTSGFCAFSAGALLADGICDLERLAASLAPAGLGAPSGERSRAETWLGLGEALVVAQRALNRAWGADADTDRPEWARAQLDAPGMLEEYIALREGALREGRASSAEFAEEVASGTGESLELEPAEPRATRAGRVTLRCSGALARALGSTREVAIELPARLDDVLRRAAEATPAAAELFVRGGRSLPAVYRAGKKLAPNALVADGDRLDLVLVISGG